MGERDEDHRIRQHAWATAFPVPEDVVRYISLFSGIGGLEAADQEPLLFCEVDEHCRQVLHHRFEDAELHDDVATLSPPSVEVVAGGWPCQDISVAGLQEGLSGDRSGLFFEMLRIAKEAKAHTLIGENVPNLLRMDNGKAFELVVRSLEDAGYPFVSWRTINAREFGLPHERRRVFIVASRNREIALALHRPIETPDHSSVTTKPVGAYYWTAGTHSICYNEGYVPTLKVGSSLSIPSPPAIHFRHVTRKVSPDEALRLQGFDPGQFPDLKKTHAYSMAGNAVARPVGQWVFDSVGSASSPPLTIEGFGFTGDHGFVEGGVRKVVAHPPTPLASNLQDFVDLEDTEPMSERAAAGLLRRLHRSGKPCPVDLLGCLIETAGDSLEDALKDPAAFNGQDPGIESEEAAEEDRSSASLELFA